MKASGIGTFSTFSSESPSRLGPFFAKQFPIAINSKDGINYFFLPFLMVALLVASMLAVLGPCCIVFLVVVVSTFEVP